MKNFELAVQAAESQVKLTHLAEKAGAATGNKKSKGPAVSELAVKAAGAVSGNKKLKGKVAVRSTIDRSLGNKSEFDFDGESVEKDGVQIENTNMKEKVKNKSKGKVAAMATTPVTSTTKHKAKSTTPVTSAFKHNAKAKPLEFDVNAVSFGIDETKAADVINFAKVKAKSDVIEAQVDVDEAFLHKVDVIVASVEIDSTRAADIIDAKVDVDTASVEDKASRAADAIDVQVYVETVSLQKDESIAADTIHTLVEVVTASVQTDETGAADIIDAQVDVEKTMKLEKQMRSDHSNLMLMMMNWKLHMMGSSMLRSNHSSKSQLMPSS